MKIALMAQDGKKELMVQFCIAYCEELSRHELCATATTGKLITDATGLKVDILLPGQDGGVNQIASKAAFNELDLIFFFKDPSAPYASDLSYMTLLKECDLNQVALVTNLATAELMMRGLRRKNPNKP